MLTCLRHIVQLQLGAMQHWGYNCLQEIAKPGSSFPDLRLLPILPGLLEHQAESFPQIPTASLWRSHLLYQSDGHGELYHNHPA